jgi:hypothetical protein
MSEVITLEEKEQPLTWEEIQALMAPDDPTDYIKATTVRRDIQIWNGVVHQLKNNLPDSFTMEDLIDVVGQMQQEIEELQNQIDAWECWRDESPY